MLVCPNCLFENPNTNKFCQECGTSLTQNICPECNELVPFEVENCQNCGAIAGVTWWAIVMGVSSDSPQSSVVGNLAGLDAYLDPQKRYRILDFLPSTDGANSAERMRVLDCQPFQLSFLDALLKRDSEGSPIESPTSTGGTQAASVNDTATNRTIQSVTIPAIAQSYLALQDNYYQALPILHDAWQQNGQQILLLEDRSAFPAFTEIWFDEGVTIPQLQLLHWFYEMVELWSILEAGNAQQSLLEASNLRVDEDQAICLQQLHITPVDKQPDLKQLGRFWQMLFAQSQRTQLGAVSLLLSDLETGRVATVADLRSRIEAIAHDLQALSEPEPMPNPTPTGAAEAPMTEPPVAGQTTTPLETSPATTSERLELDELTTLVEDEGDSESDDLPTVVLPMQLFNLEDAGRTDIGRQRDHNEDYFGIETQVSRLESPSGKTVHARNLYILCDGMGGHAGGEVASALAVDTLRQFFKERWQSAPFSNESLNKLPGADILSEAVILANKAIFDVNQQNARSGSGRMGTTLVLLLVCDTEAAVAHVGDSRLYRYTRKRGLEQLTIDHEVGQREIQRGVDPDIAYARPDAYQLTQALGPRDEHFIKPDVQYFELNEDSLLLLCSDGLSDNDLLETHHKTHIEPLLSSQTNLDQGVGQLIDLANQYNGHDNITAIAIRAKVRPNLDHLR